MEGLRQDLRYGMRVFARNPAFAATAITTFALGIAVTTVMFTVFYSVLFRSLPYRDPERLLLVYESVIGKAPRLLSPSTPAYFDLKKQTDVFEEVVAYRRRVATWTGAGEPARIAGTAATANIFRLGRAQPFMGRAFGVEEGEPGRNHVLVLSYGMWRSWFGADPKVLGKTVRIDGQAHTVVGVMPASGGYPTTSYWVPWVKEPSDHEARNIRGGLQVAALRRPGVSLAQAQAAMDTLASQLAQAYPTSNSGYGISLVPLHESVVQHARPTLQALLGAVVFLLLIGCANIANLLLARAADRDREMAVRAALGAASGRLIRQLLTESMLLAALGGALGIGLAHWGVRALLVLRPANLPRLDEVNMDWPVLLFASGLSMACGLFFGLLPALRASTPNLVQALKLGGGSRLRSHRVAHSALVAVQITLAVVLLVGALLMLRSLTALQRVEIGFDPRNILTVPVELPEGPATPQRKAAFVSELLGRLKLLPDVRLVACASSAPLHPTRSFTIVSHGEAPAADPRESIGVQVVRVSADYFQLLGIPLVEGRAFDAVDRGGSAPAAVISRDMARRHWPGQSPIGRKLYSRAIGAIEIIGVANDVRYGRLEADLGPVLYLHYSQPTTGLDSMIFLIRAGDDPLRLAPLVKQSIWAMDAGLPVEGIQTAEQLYDRWFDTRKFYAASFGVFATLAVCLAAVGLYGVLSYSIARRTQEIGVRLALGATRRDIMRMIMHWGMALVLPSVAIGVLGALALARVVKTLLFQVPPDDSWALVAAVLALMVVVLAACWVPAARAARVDPLVALREE